MTWTNRPRSRPRGDYQPNGQRCDTFTGDGQCPKDAVSYQQIGRTGQWVKVPLCEQHEWLTAWYAEHPAVIAAEVLIRTLV